MGNGMSVPVGTYKEAAMLLRRPFTAEAVKFKPQSVTKTGKTMCVAYIDARLVVERLNLVVPDLWYDDYEPLGQRHLVCRLTVDGVTRQDIGEGQGKALYSDALKRAAVKFGIGVSLYAIPVNFIDGAAKFLSDQQVATLRENYRRWLASVGVQAFGEPLDHGDVAGAAGDVEADEAVVEPTVAMDPFKQLGEVIQIEEQLREVAANGTPLEYVATAIRAKDPKALSKKQWEAFQQDAAESDEARKMVADALATIYTEIGGDIGALRENYKRIKDAA